MCLYLSLVIAVSSSLFSLSSAQEPEYATRVNTAFRFPIPYPTPTNQYNTHESSSTPLSISQDWSTPSDYSLWIIQTDSYSPGLSETSVPIIDTLTVSTMSSFVLNDGDRASSRLQTVESTRTTALTTSSITGLPKLASSRTDQETTTSSAPAPLSNPSTGGVASQPLVAAVPIGALAAAALGITALL